MSRFWSALLALMVLLAVGLAWAQPSKKKPKPPPAAAEEKKEEEEEPKKKEEKKEEEEEPKKKEEEPKKEEPAAPKKEAAASGDDQPSITATIPCSACHTTTGWKATDAENSGDSKFDHSTTGFPLTGEHVKTPCVGCHDGKRAIKRSCISCHNDAHRARLGMVCERCHTPSNWRNTRSLDMHRLTRFPLTGMHVLRDCTECHRRASEHQWTGVPIECFACHEKDYRRPDLRPVHNGSVAGQNAFPRDCSLCHRPIGWAPARFDTLLITESSAIPLKVAAPPMHDMKFPISFGVHRTASCDDCHTNAQSSPRSIRCTGCHAHEPVRLAAQHKNGVSPLASSCLSCHPGGIRR